jgi:hypothetical protein
MGRSRVSAWLAVILVLTGGSAMAQQQVRALQSERSLSLQTPPLITLFNLIARIDVSRTFGKSIS